MPKHYLYDIDLKKLTAFCTVCGNTKIVIPTTRTGRTYRPVCSNKAKESREKQLEKLEREKEERHSHSRWPDRHTLSNINPVAKMAICAVCGPTDIWVNHRKTGKTTYSCGNQSREFLREYKRSHREGRSSNPHVLSQIDDAAGTAVCATCGPVKINRRLVNKYVTRRCINAPPPRKARKIE